jgi:hypothetical protein
MLTVRRIKSKYILFVVDELGVNSTLILRKYAVGIPVDAPAFLRYFAASLGLCREATSYYLH